MGWWEQHDKREHQLYVGNTPRWRRTSGSCVFWIFVVSPLALGLAMGWAKTLISRVDIGSNS